MDKLTYVAFFKPFDVLTSFTDDEGRGTLKEYINVPDIYPVGRLDMDSEGLLLLTNDGPLAHRLTDPRFNHPKTYLVQVEGVPTTDMLAKLEGGIEIKDYTTRRAQVIVAPEPNLPPRSKPVTPHGPTTWLRIVIREGKKRQIRHMTAAVGLPTLRLVRVAMGQVTLGELKPGEWRYLTAAEVDSLKQLVSSMPEQPKPPKTPQPQPRRVEQRPARSRGNARGPQKRGGGRRPSGR